MAYWREKTNVVFSANDRRHIDAIPRQNPGLPAAFVCATLRSVDIAEPDVQLADVFHQ